MIHLSRERVICVESPGTLVLVVLVECLLGRYVELWRSLTCYQHTHTTEGILLEETVDSFKEMQLSQVVIVGSFCSYRAEGFKVAP